MTERKTFCGRDDCHLDREKKMKPLSDGGCCDPCIEPIIQALHAAGIGTVASCCGHGFMHGSIALADGRELVIARDYDEAREIDRTVTTTDINGNPYPPALPDDVVRLVIAARIVAYEGQHPDDVKELDRAVEAFAERVPWDEEPEPSESDQGLIPIPDGYAEP